MQWKEIASATTIGYKRILRFQEIDTTRLRVRILDARANAAIAGFAAYHYNQAPSKVSLYRDKNGQVTLTPEAKYGLVDIRYSLDGSELTKESTLYKDKFDLAQGAHFKACCFIEGKKGPVLDINLGLIKLGWKATGSSQGGNEAQKAIDMNNRSYWHTPREEKEVAHPHHL